MKRILNVFGSSVRPLVGFFLLTLLFTACKKDDDDIIQNNAPVAGLMAFNLSPDQPSVGFSLSGNTLGNVPLSYNSYTGGYLPVYIGTREIRSFDANSGTTLAIASGSFMDSMYYSTFLVGSNSHYRNLLVNDQLNGLTVVPGKAWVRYINAITDTSASPAITIGGDAAVSVPFATVSSFTQANAGQLTASVSNGADINAGRTLTIQENKAYTLLFVGTPGAVDSSKTVQIRMIENGTVTP